MVVLGFRLSGLSLVNIELASQSNMLPFAGAHGESLLKILLRLARLVL